MFRLICIAIGYAIGCIQTAFIIGKLCKTDLSKKGSGNLGTTNALRVLGFKAGLATFICDILKGVVSFLLARWLFPDEALLAGLYSCAGTILGHDFPFYLRFKGGKGIAATIGMVLCVGFTASMPLMLISFAIGIVAVAMSGYISLGSMLFSVAIPICAFLWKLPLEASILTAVMAALALWQHRANIGRLRTGNENKFTLRKNV
ncbi:MAG TPA: glycerol-3-phosphate 1-O-acyltransferase PlsY [Candidatus Anaerotignum merdipullorum]|nr:glycerol-3-phosphate 1-O-acyltransferase PlsY [Candidatus Anaerotignum merdipullorum]